MDSHICKDYKNILDIKNQTQAYYFQDYFDAKQ